jgi:hypothetical protein
VCVCGCFLYGCVALVPRLRIGLEWGKVSYSVIIIMIGFFSSFFLCPLHFWSKRRSRTQKHKNTKIVSPRRLLALSRVRVVPWTPFLSLDVVLVIPFLAFLILAFSFFTFHFSLFIPSFITLASYTTASTTAATSFTSSLNSITSLPSAQSLELPRYPHTLLYNTHTYIHTYIHTYNHARHPTNKVQYPSSPYPHIPLAYPCPPQ